MEFLHLAQPEPTGLFGRLPDSVVLIILEKILDMKALGACRLVSRRFDALVPQVGEVSARLSLCESNKHIKGGCGVFFFSSLLLRWRRWRLLGHVAKPSGLAAEASWHFPEEPLRAFQALRRLRVTLPRGELSLRDGSHNQLLQWRAEFGATFIDYCIVLGASNVTTATTAVVAEKKEEEKGTETDNQDSQRRCRKETIQQRVRWTASCIVTAYARQILLRPSILRHRSLEALAVGDRDKQGMLCMGKKQLDECRASPLPASWCKWGGMGMSMRVWYSPMLGLPNGTALHEATLIVVHPDSKLAPTTETLHSSVFKADNDKHGTFECATLAFMAAKHTHLLHINSF